MKFINKVFSYDHIVELFSEADEDDVDEFQEEKERITDALYELIMANKIRRDVYDQDCTEIVYGVQTHLAITEYTNMENNTLNKNIMSLWVDDDSPRQFVVLQNTQKGKLGICAKEFVKAGKEPKLKVVSVFVTQNDKTLAEQSSEALTKHQAKIFTLSSNSKISVDDIFTYIDAYHADKSGEYKPPIIVLLANRIQNDKIIKLLDRVCGKVRTQKSKLRYFIIFDEADATYPSLRNSYLPFMDVNETALYRTGFVTATGDDLIEFPECLEAQLHVAEFDAEDDANYRSLHHLSDVRIVEKQPARKYTNNSYAEHIISSNLPYFLAPIVNQSGQPCFRKIIVNSNVKNADMQTLAKFANRQGINSLVVNQRGVTLFQDGGEVCCHKTKDKRFNKLLFDIYKQYGLDNRPLMIAGQYKVNRGLAYHYAPRDGTEGLIWTDMILGCILDQDSAVQKAGRLAGIIAQCPQYVKSVYWTDQSTYDLVFNHNSRNDRMNALNRICTVRQARISIQRRTGKQVPIVISEGFRPEDLIFTLCGGSAEVHNARKTYIKNLIQKSTNPILQKLHTFISNPQVELLGISKSSTDKTTQVNITNVVQACNEQRGYELDNDDDSRAVNHWKVWIDGKNRQYICITVWVVDPELLDLLI